jgi:Heavy metal binding domain
MNSRFPALWILFGFTWAACSPGPVPISQSPRDPSNPSAPEGIVPPIGSGAPSTHGSSESPPADGHARHHHGQAGSAPAGQPTYATDAGSSSAVYTCPMHPEVTSAVPGRCPKCGMNLVPAK